MRLVSLGSSSRGNSMALFLERGAGKEPAALLLEAGFPYQAIARRLAAEGIPLSRLSAALLSHSHKDHAAGAKDLAKRGLPVFATKGTLEAIGLPEGHAVRYGIPFPVAEGCAALAFRVRHDAPEPAGYVIKTSKECAVFAIDNAGILDDLSGVPADYALLEADYDGSLMAMEQLSLLKKGDAGSLAKWRLNERVKSAHSSFRLTCETLRGLDRSRMRAVFLTHLSDRMSAPARWKAEIEAQFGIPCHVLRRDGGIEG